MVFIGGGPGAGKSTLLEKNPVIRQAAPIIFDAMLSNLEGVEHLIGEARQAGKEVDVLYVQREAMDAYRGVLQRAAREGRVPSIEYFLRVRQDVAQTFAPLTQRYRDDPHVRLRAIENPGEDSPDSTFRTVDVLPAEDYAGIRGSLV